MSCLLNQNKGFDSKLTSLCLCSVSFVKQLLEQQIYPWFLLDISKFWSNTYRNKTKTKMNLVLFCIAWFWWLWCGIRSRSPSLQQRIGLVLCYTDSLDHHEASLWWVAAWGCLFLTWQSRNEACCHEMSTLFPFVSGCISFPSAERFSLLLSSDIPTCTLDTSHLCWQTFYFR